MENEKYNFGKNGKQWESISFQIMFYGQYEHSLDNKNRVSVPVRFRESLVGQQKGLNFFITPGLDRCLFLFPQEDFQKVVNDLEKVPFTKAEIRRFQRIFVGKASPCSCDRLGRIMIPESLKAFAGIEKEVVFLGLNHRIEIWNKEIHGKQETESLSDYENIAGNILY